MANYIIKNLTASPVEIADCGLVVPASGERTVLGRRGHTIGDSTDIITEINADSIVFLDNDGTTQLTKAASLALLEQKYDARAFLNSNDFIPLSLRVKDLDLTTLSNWAVGRSAAGETDSLNPSLDVAVFDDSNEEGAGFVTHIIPPTATKIKITFVHKRQTSGAAANTVLVYLYARGIPNGSPVPISWSPKTLFTTANVPAGRDFVYEVGIADLSSFNIQAGEATQIQITRDGGTLSGNWNLLQLKVEFL